MVTRSDGPGREKVKGWTSFKEIFFRSVCHMIEHVSALGTRERMLTLFCTQLLFNRIQLVPESYFERFLEKILDKNNIKIKT